MSILIKAVLIFYMICWSVPSEGQSKDSGQSVVLAHIDTLNKRGFENVFSNPAEARLQFDSAIEMATTHRYPSGLAVALKNKAISFDIQGNTKEAIQFFLESLKVFEKLQDTLGIARVKNNLGVAYKNLNDFDRARNYYNESLELKRMIGDTRGEAYGYSNIGELYLIEKKFKVALPIFEKAKLLLDSLDDNQGLSVVLSNIGEIYFELGEYEKVIGNVKEAASIEMTMENNYDLAQSYNMLAKAYLELGNLELAWSYQAKAEDLAKQVGILKIMYQNQLIKVDLHKRTGHFKDAVSTYDHVIVLRDSLSKVNLAEEIAAIQSKYDFKQKEETIRSLKSEATLSQKLINSQNSLIVYIVLVILLLVALLSMSVYFYRVIRKKNDALSAKVSDLRKTQLELKDHEEQLETFFRYAPDAVIILNQRGVVTDWNPTAKKIFGWTKGKILGKPLLRNVIVDFPNETVDWDEFLERNVNHLDNHTVETGGLRKDGALLTIALSVSNTTIKGERYFIVFARDITDKRKAETELIKAKQLAESANKAKTEFLSNISHEIRTPLNAIIGFSEILKTKTETPDNFVYTEHILKAGQNLMLLINDILDLSKIEAGVLTLTPVAVDMKLFLVEIESFFHITRKQTGLQFDVHVHSSTPQAVVVDPVRLRQILYNLLGNAFKFTHFGSVTLSVNAFHNQNGRGDLRFIVEDTGIGIPQDKQALIFEAFRQLDGQNSRKYGGTGLGLTITKRLVTLMGGSIEVRSTVDKGTAFIVTVPYLLPESIESDFQLLERGIL